MDDNLLEFTLEDVFVPLHNTRHLENVNNIENDYQRFEERIGNYFVTAFNSLLWTSLALYLSTY